MLHMLQRIGRASRDKSRWRATERICNRVGFVASLDHDDLLAILRAEGLTDPRRRAKK